MMNQKRIKNLGLRIDKETHDKIFFIASYEGRSGSGQILYLMRKYIAEFEKEHGKIQLDDDNQPERESFRYGAE